MKRVHIEDIGSVEELPPSITQESLGTTKRPGEENIRSATATSDQLDSTPFKTATSTDSAKVIEIDSSNIHGDTVTLAGQKIQPKPTATTQTLFSRVPHTQTDSDSISTHPAQPVVGGTKMEVVQKQPQQQTELLTEPAEKQLQPVTIPCVPDSSLQFQADWKRLRRDETALTTYFKVRC